MQDLLDSVKPEVADSLMEEKSKTLFLLVLSKQCSHFRLNARTTVGQNSGQITLTLAGADGSQTVSGSHLLVATGRRPNTEELELDKAGIETDKDGFITVNNRLETKSRGSGSWVM